MFKTDEIPINMCIICNDGLPKYKFSCCKKSFCSIKCFKEHSSDTCSFAKVTDVKEEKTTTNTREDLDCELNFDEIKAIRRNRHVSEWLESRALRRAITGIDQSSSSRERLSKLSTWMKSEEFLQFAHTLMGAMGHESMGDFKPKKTLLM